MNILSKNVWIVIKNWRSIIIVWWVSVTLSSCVLFSFLASRVGWWLRRKQNSHCTVPSTSKSEQTIPSFTWPQCCYLFDLGNSFSCVIHVGLESPAVPLMTHLKTFTSTYLNKKMKTIFKQVSVGKKNLKVRKFWICAQKVVKNNTFSIKLYILVTPCLFIPINSSSLLDFRPKLDPGCWRTRSECLSIQFNYKRILKIISEM